MYDLITDPLFWLILGWAFLPSIVCYYMALKKRRSTLFWLLAGLVLMGWIAVLILYFLPELPPKKYNIEKPSRIDSKLKMYQTLSEMKEEKEKKTKTV